MSTSAERDAEGVAAIWEATRTGKAVLADPLATHNELINSYVLVTKGADIGTPHLLELDDGWNTRGSEDCVFCRHQQHHVPHTERHIRDGLKSFSMWRNAVILSRSKVTVSNDGFAQSLPRLEDRTRAYLKHALALEATTKGE